MAPSNLRKRGTLETALCSEERRCVCALGANAPAAYDVTRLEANAAVVEAEDVVQVQLMIVVVLAVGLGMPMLLCCGEYAHLHNVNTRPRTRQRPRSPSPSPRQPT